MSAGSSDSQSRSTRAAGASKLRVAVDQNQGCIHHTISAAILSYSPWVPKNRIARTPADIGGLRPADSRCP